MKAGVAEARRLRLAPCLLTRRLLGERAPSRTGVYSVVQPHQSGMWSVCGGDLTCGRRSSARNRIGGPSRPQVQHASGGRRRPGVRPLRGPAADPGRGDRPPRRAPRARRPRPGREAAAGAARPRRLTRARSRPSPRAAVLVCSPARGEGSGPSRADPRPPLPARRCHVYGSSGGRGAGGRGAGRGDGGRARGRETCLALPRFRRGYAGQLGPKGRHHKPLWPDSRFSGVPRLASGSRWSHEVP